MRLREVEKLLSDYRHLPISKIIKKFAGEQLGCGGYRDVYVLKDAPRYVIKIERDMTTANFCNACEWRNYINHRGTRIEKYFAPCYGINEAATFLIQGRLTKMSDDKKDFPKRIPALFTDTHIGNFGWIKDQFVSCDYPHILSAGYNLVEVKWRGGV